ncbi:Gfo/Idh/MocA family protein [Micromonospora rifamycinica]|uniref:Oxidoreductase family, C-terminal alpha/beta domain n=1 Tax=Micromonospora rifamycinica TaxID=291594 RepID=A0A120F8P5_9ACTN|nr:Gfo/Idh/MocA family oxidoreductase [Micromonospora rifamycinica]KWV32166.1 dehydrogenase [Micromonospora rifamycinica]SCG44092.1 Oxidoreductase family, C-terminal alpha/beta domain [Micromonospora rifamycinica]
MSPPAAHRRRHAVVGTGARAEMFVRALVTEHADTAALVAFADVNQTRMDAHNRWLAELGHPAVPTYRAEDFATMLDRERVDVVLVTSVDVTHDEYIVAALRAGCDVVTEKPMTVDAARCRRILDAVAETGRRVTVAFNYRYNPLHEQVRRLLADGAVGEIGSVHFEWLLDVRHGADYFRRWHRDKASSGGLMVHKASHHFDLVNWWLDATPVEVYAAGRLFFYGDGGRRHGYARDYDRAHDAPAAADDPFALRLAEHPRLRELYLDAEAEDGYHRDQNVFAPGVTIEDDMAVLARYSTGATMTYHLTAYAPWEGYRVMVNGSRGRLELEVTESDFVSPAAARALKGAALHGDEAAAENGAATLTLRPFWSPPTRIPVEGYTRQGHGGADARMTRVIFGGEPDPLDRAATAHDGALALLTGLAANRSFTTGDPVRVADLLTPP